MAGRGWGAVGRVGAASPQQRRGGGQQHGLGGREERGHVGRGVVGVVAWPSSGERWGEARRVGERHDGVGRGEERSGGVASDGGVE